MNTLDAAINALALHATKYRGGWAAKHKLGKLEPSEQSPFYLWLTMSAQLIATPEADTVAIVNGALELLKMDEPLNVLVMAENYRQTLERKGGA